MESITNIFGELDNMIDESDKDEKYLTYLSEHINNVKKAYRWICSNAQEIIDMIPLNESSEYNIEEVIANHDSTKFNFIDNDHTEFDCYGNLFCEYVPYREYFYGDGNNEHEFDLAWLHHQHSNPHHYQYWVLLKDDGSEKILDMPVTFIIEMFCDHWSFSWKHGDLTEVDGWYNRNKNNMVMSDFTRAVYEDILRIVMDRIKLQGDLDGN